MTEQAPTPEQSEAAQIAVFEELNGVPFGEGDRGSRQFDEAGDIAEAALTATLEGFRSEIELHKPIVVCECDGVHTDGGCRESRTYCDCCCEQWPCLVDRLGCRLGGTSDRSRQVVLNEAARASEAQNRRWMHAIKANSALLDQLELVRRQASEAAWDEGARAGYRMHEERPADMLRRNPYRAEKSR